MRGQPCSCVHACALQRMYDAFACSLVQDSMRTRPHDAHALVLRLAPMLVHKCATSAERACACTLTSIHMLVHECAMSARYTRARTLTSILLHMHICATSAQHMRLYSH